MPPTPHDALFRATLSIPSVALGQLRAVLPPALLEALEPGPPEVLPQSFVDEALRGTQADVVLRARLRGGGELYVFCLLEHQSTPDPRMAWRLLLYCTRLWERWAQEHPAEPRLPLIVPVVVYQGGRPWQVPRALSESLHVPLPDAPVELRYHLEDLSEVPEDELTGRALLGLTKLLLKFSREPTQLAARLPRWAETWRAAEAEGGLGAMQRVLRYIVEVGQPEIKPRLQELIQQAATPHTETYMTMAEFERLEGRREGMREGMREGEVRGQRRLLASLLERRFGALSPAQQQRLEGASAEELGELALRVLEARSAAELLGG